MPVDRFATIALSALATYALQSTIVLTLAWLITSRLTARFDQVAEYVWKTALSISVIAPFIQVLLSAVAPQHSDAIGTEPVYLMQTRATPDFTVLFVVWMVVAALAVARLLLAHRQLARVLADRRALSAEEKTVALGCCDESRAAISVTSAITVPISYSGEVCLPTSALVLLSGSELRAVVAHETAHLERHDARWRSASALLARVFFFQPLNLLAGRRLRNLAEAMCDQYAIAKTSSPADLASALATFASLLVERPQLLVPSLACSESLVLRRVKRVLATDDTVRLAFQAPKWMVACAAVSAMVGVSIAGPRVEAALPPAMPYVLTAHDPAGTFTLTIDRGRVVSASLGDQKLPGAHIRQRGNNLELFDGSTSFSVNLTPRGGITWSPRPQHLTHF